MQWTSASRTRLTLTPDVFCHFEELLNIVPPELGWKALLPLDGAALEDQYRMSLEKLGVKPGMLGVILRAPDARYIIRPF